MAIDLSRLSSGMTTIKSLADLIIVSPQKKTSYSVQNKNGITLEKSILFSYDNENSITLTSDITDYTIEDNTTINDHISNKPITITVSAIIGELNSNILDEPEALRIARERLPLVAAYLPQLTVEATRVYNLALQAYTLAAQLIKQGQQTINALTGEEPLQNNQQTYYTKFYDAWVKRNLFTVQTPWARFTDMAIQTLRVVQGEDSESYSSFEITFKQLAFARTKSIPKKEVDERLKNQQKVKVNQGSTSGVSTTKSFSGSLPK